MKRILVLHFESRRGKLHLQGPGDTLRLLHSLRQIASSQPARKFDIVTLSKPWHVAGLLTSRTPRVSRNATSFQEGKFRWLKLNTAALPNRKLRSLVDSAVQQHSLNGAHYEKVVHAHLLAEGRGNSPQISLLAGKKRHTVPRERIDTHHCSHGTLTLGLARSRRAKPTLRVAVFIRSGQFHSARNTPKKLVDDIRIALQQSGRQFQLVFHGTATRNEAIPFGYRSGDKHCTYVNKSLREQILELSESDCAIGVNSGGLDLACAAGIPVLRHGEYQPVDGWGIRYNQFLASATNVGRVPGCRESVKRYNRGRFRTDVENFVHNLATLQTARHVLIPEGVTFNGTVRQLLDYESSNIRILPC